MDVPIFLIEITVGAMAVLVVTKWVLRKLTIGKYGTRHVVITGCDTGFGNLATHKFDKLGFHVFAGCLTEAGVSELTNGCSDRVQAFRLDVTNKESIERGLAFVKSKLPKETGLWGIVNNAGIATPYACIEFQSNEQFERCLAVNLFGVINVTKAFLPVIRLGRGRIVNVSSLAGRLSGPYMAPYNISKYGVEAFSDSLRREMYNSGVTVHIIEPGIFLTNICNIDKVRNDTREAISEADEEVLAYYGKKESEQVMEIYASRFVAKGASTKIGKVPDAFVHALTALYPKYRYIVVEWHANIIVRLLWNLPEFISDYLLVILADCPVPVGARRT